jgi:hypothetical protein
MSNTLKQNKYRLAVQAFRNSIRILYELTGIPTDRRAPGWEAQYNSALTAYKWKREEMRIYLSGHEIEAIVIATIVEEQPNG